MQKNGNNGILEMLFPVLAPWADRPGEQGGSRRRHVPWASGVLGDGPGFMWQTWIQQPGLVQGVPAHGTSPIQPWALPGMGQMG